MTALLLDSAASSFLYGKPAPQRRLAQSERDRCPDDQVPDGPVPMETFYILICHYCGEQVEDKGLLPGHTHHGEMEKHGHELPVFIPATWVEVNRRSDRLRREGELLARLKEAEESLERMRRWLPAGEGTSAAPPVGS